MEAPAPTPEKVIFLDIDGVLNTRKQHPNKYSGIEPTPTAQLNALLLAEPKAQLVISSAWRYLCLNGSMTIQGFEAMLLTHGVDCFGRVFGCTQSDELAAKNLLVDAEAMELGAWHDWLKQNAAKVRSIQVLDFVAKHGLNLKQWVVLDDVPMPVLQNTGRMVVVNHQYGLRPVEVDRAKVVLNMKAGGLFA